MKEVSLTDTEDEADDDEPATTPHDIIAKATICKYYGFFKEAIGNQIINIYIKTILQFYFLVDYMNKESSQIGGPNCVVEIGKILYTILS